VLIDKNGQFRYRSPSALKITGVSTDERQQQGLNIVHPDDLALLLQERELLLTGNRQTFVRVIRVTNNQGKYIWMELAVTNLLNVPGVEALVINARDISQHKKAEEDIRSLNELLEKKVALRTEQLEAANKELEAFSYSVSHDLKAPLRVIEGYAKILARPKNNLSEEIQRDLAMISENAIKMSHLINALLNFSRLGRAPLSKKMVDMDSLVTAAVNELKNTEGPLNAVINIAPLKASHCDQALIYRVWINLIHNAIKYSKRRANPVVEIGMNLFNGQPTYFVIDNGVGFDMKNAERLFSVFQRLHKDSDFEGTGVGLALVNSIIKKHEGKIWVEAEEEKGATFYFTLPV
jgi:PAS domain S-box-containing protein